MSENQSAGAAMLFIGALVSYGILIFWLEDYFDHGGIILAGLLCPIFGLGVIFIGCPILGIEILVAWTLALFALVVNAVRP